MLGVFYLAASIIMTPRLGAANTVAFVLAGQVLPSMTLDQLGLLNLPVHSISLARLGAAALVIAGVFVVLRTGPQALVDAGVPPSFFAPEGLH